MRRLTKKIKLKDIYIGGGSPITVQSMTNTDTRDLEKTVTQIKRLEKIGCEIVRIAVPDEKALENIPEILKNIKIPLIADIHFDYRLALGSIEKGVHCVRINPGNIGGVEKTRVVIQAAKLNGCAIRLGINAGSLEKDILKKMGVNSDALVESTLRNIKIFEDENFENLKVSLKASSVPMTIDAYRKISTLIDYPLHIGVTEAGTKFSGTIRSAVGIGTLLAEGIGDTLRVSLTADPEEEVKVGWEILRSLGLRKRGVEIISCPTCGRTEIDLIRLAEKVETILQPIDHSITVAVMGCPVNGPGEAREADYGIAGGKNLGIIFKKGEVIKKVREEDLLDEFIKIIKFDLKID
ncbi:MULTISPECIES: flavodoxin-dependent (E)-4-hydroxy-3-methylbut-2-enyl-diphosphate synthase [Calditerrivibrio]|uniref:4-hydroxy-3-methylbut-2-en-1-yl diphosphate synthase (flavodoxin) n=1 Tax=Calditerrivibrio nitroreducens TaxID=477976 RepID=A0A2J6WRB4_9BACT|nr:MAG: 4-hydroxy-3-methylbut-2-en-1-yl diphosphate synthase [Calditerrivibrio nitroreducens]